MSSVLSSLPTPLRTTFAILAMPNSAASIAVLEHALRSEMPAIRMAALQTLLGRGKEPEMQAIVRSIDYCNHDELPFLLSHASLLTAPIEAALADKDPEFRQRGLVAISKLKVSSLFHHLIGIAESPDDPQQIVATQLLDTVSTDLGASARQRVSLDSNPNRQQLLRDLTDSIARFSKHRVTAIIDCWLLCSHWEDHGFRELFSSVAPDNAPAILKRMRQLHRPEIGELLCGTLWSKSSSSSMSDMMLEWKSSEIQRFVIALERRFGLTSNLAKNLSTSPLPCLVELDLSHTQEPLDSDHASLLRLLVASNVTPDIVLRNVNVAIHSDKKEVLTEAANAIRSLRTMKPEIVVMVLSDCFDMPDIDPYEPPPWKGSLRKELDRLLSKYHELPSVVRNAVDYLFSEFRCEELFQHAEYWPDAHVRVYGRIVRLVDRNCVFHLQAEAQSTSSTKRAKAIRMIRYLGNDDRLMEIAKEHANDEHETVRIQAIQVLANGDNRQFALEWIRPLLKDEDRSVRAAAEQALEKLGKEQTNGFKTQ